MLYTSNRVGWKWASKQAQGKQQKRRLDAPCLQNWKQFWKASYCCLGINETKSTQHGVFCSPVMHACMFCSSLFDACVSAPCELLFVARSSETFINISTLTNQGASVVPKHDYKYAHLPSVERFMNSASNRRSWKDFHPGMRELSPVRPQESGACLVKRPGSHSVFPARPQGAGTSCCSSVSSWAIPGFLQRFTVVLTWKALPKVLPKKGGSTL